MASEKTRADSLRFYHTGAASDGGAAQTDPDVSCGKYRSTTEWEPVGFTQSGGASNITVLYVSGSNPLGAGTISIESTSSVAWQPYGGTKGSTVTIANGETKVLESGDHAYEFIRISRTSATNLAGNITVTIADVYNNVVAQDNVTVAEQTAGHDEARCVAIKNDSTSEVANIEIYLGTLGTQATSDAAQLDSGGAGTLQTTDSFADWPTSGYCLVRESGGTVREVVYYSERTETTLTVPAAGRGLLETTAAAGAADDTLDAHPGFAVASEAPGSGNVYTDKTADQGKPSGLTWYVDVEAGGDTLTIASLDAAAQYGLWMWSEIPAGAVASASNLKKVVVDFEAA